MDDYINEALSLITAHKGTPSAVQDVYLSLLHYVEDVRLGGACHSTSAILHILLSEKGIQSVIRIGEVYSTEYRFDHSWIEIQGEIFDIAVGYPSEGGIKLSGPVFDGIDLHTLQPTALAYGCGLEGGLDEDAWLAASRSLGAYFQSADDNAANEPKGEEHVPFWERAASIARACGIAKTSAELAADYFEVRRVESYASDHGEEAP